ncbi:MAG: hypothetical protein U0670_19095 [Anaerolineae bacterium]
MRRDELTDLYLDSLRRDPQAVPPPGLDDETAAILRALVQSERIAPDEQLAHRTRARLWADALQQHYSTQKENPSMTSYALPRTPARGNTIPYLYAFAALLVVLFAAVLISQQGSGGPGMPQNGGSPNDTPLLAGSPNSDQQAAQAEPTQTATPIPAQPVLATGDRAQIEAQIAVLQTQIEQLQAVLNGSPFPASTALPPAQSSAGGVNFQTLNSAGTLTTGDLTITWLPSVQALGSVPAGGYYAVYGEVNAMGSVSVNPASPETQAMIELSDASGQAQITLSQADVSQIPVGGPVIVVGTVDQAGGAPVFHAFLVSDPGVIVQHLLTGAGGMSTGTVMFPNCVFPSTDSSPLPLPTIVLEALPVVPTELATLVPPPTATSTPIR